MRCPMVPVHVERLPGARFRVVFDEPIALSPEDPEAPADATRLFLRSLERWIGAQPGQWLCTKRRWPKPSYAVANALESPA